ncbi:MAG: hypothetical protein IJL77_04685 [Clostridia bacterium]|nr:hypothetical protein [Clostridia bacterium]
MGIVALKCPGCGANVEFDSSRDYGFCEYCGTKVMQEKVIIEHRIDESDKYNNYIKLADGAYSSRNFAEAYNYYTRSLEIRQDDCLVHFRKALCAGVMSSAGERNAEVVSGLKAAFSLADKTKQKSFANEITAFIGSKDLSEPAEFIGIQSCENHVEKIRGHVKLADSLYQFADGENKELTANYCRFVIRACDTLNQTYKYTKVNEGKKSNLNINLSLSGLSLSGNSSENPPQIYHTPQAILSDVAEIRRKFVAESNKFTVSELENKKRQLADAKEQIGKLPVMTKALHAVFSLPALAAALIIAFAVPLLGIILLAVQVICYLVYLKSEGSDEAQEAYSNYREIKEECLKTQKSLNR